MFSGGTACRKLERSMRVEEFTQPGDPLKLDYGYRNGVRGYLARGGPGARSRRRRKFWPIPPDRIRARLPDCEFTAITEIEPPPDNPAASVHRAAVRGREYRHRRLAADREVRRGFARSAAIDLSQTMWPNDLRRETLP